jgi:hypothetical protein
MILICTSCQLQSLNRRSRNHTLNRSRNHTLNESTKSRPGFKQPSPRFLCLNSVRLEAGDSRLQTRVPNRGRRDSRHYRRPGFIRTSELSCDQRANRFAFRFSRLPQVKVDLHIQPKVRRRSECLGDLKSLLRRDAGAPSSES